MTEFLLTNRFAALENLCDDEDINRAWENTKENIFNYNFVTFELNYISLVVGTLYLNMFCFCISDICSLCQLVFFSIIRGFTIF